MLKAVRAVGVVCDWPTRTRVAATTMRLPRRCALTMAYAWHPSMGVPLWSLTMRVGCCLGWM